MTKADLLSTYLNKSSSVDEHAASVTGSVADSGDAGQSHIGHTLHGHSTAIGSHIACEICAVHLHIQQPAILCTAQVKGCRQISRESVCWCAMFNT